MKEDPDSSFAAGREFVIRLRVLKDDVPGVLRVRSALKCLLRSFGLRNEGIDAVKPDERGTGDPGTTDGMPE